MGSLLFNSNLEKQNPRQAQFCGTGQLGELNEEDWLTAVKETEADSTLLPTQWGRDFHLGRRCSSP